MDGHQWCLLIRGCEDDPGLAVAVGEEHRFPAGVAMVVDRGGVAGHEDVPVGAGPRPHRHAQRVVGVDDDRLAGAFEDFGFEFGHLFEGVDAVDAEVIVLDVEQCGDVVVVAGVAEIDESFAGHLEHGGVDPGVVQGEGGAGVAGEVVGADDVVADADVCCCADSGAGAGGAPDVVQHQCGGAFAVGAGDGGGGDAARAALEEDVDDFAVDVACRVGQPVWPKSGLGVDLADGAADVAPGAADVGAQQVDAGDATEWPTSPGRVRSCEPVPATPGHGPSAAAPR